MLSTLLILTIPLSYFLICYFLTRFISKWTIHLNPYLRLITLSFFYALFWGIGIAGSSAEPGFGLPAPNIIAILMMLNDRFYQGVINGLLILCFWWTIIFLFMLIKQLYRKKRINSTFDNDNIQPST
jgi:hypothetical protein